MAEKNKIEIIIGAVDTGLQAVFGRVNKAMAAADQASKGYGRSMAALQTPIRSITGSLAQLGAAFGAVFATNRYLAVAEEYTNLDARLRLVTSSSQELASAQSALYDLSQRTGTGYAQNADVYYKLATAMKSSGVSGQELIGINEAVAKSLVVNGSSAEMTSSFLLQFGQAMGSGVLQGDEFRAMMESNSYFAQQLASALDTDVAGLRAMSKQGQLTTAVIREAVPKMLQQINADFAKMPLTIGRAMTMLSNAFGKIVNGSNQAGGATGKIAAAVKSFVDYLDSNGAAVEAWIVNLIEFAAGIAKAAWEYKGFIAAFAGTALAVSAVATLTTAVRGLAAAMVLLNGVSFGKWLTTAAAGMSNTAIAAGGLKTAIGALAGVFLAWEVGWSIGTFLNKFDVVKKAGITMAHGLTMAWLQARKVMSEMTGGDTAAVERDIENARTTYRSMIDEINGKTKDMAAEQKTAQSTIAAAVTESANTQKQVSGEALEAMKAKYKAYADEVKRLQDEIAGREKSLYDQLRDMARSGMTGVDAWTDMKQQAQEYETVARAAAEAGDFTTAVEYADKAKDLYAQLNTEVKDGDKVLVSQADALKTAMSGVESAGKIAVDALKAQQEAADGAMNALTEESGFQNLREGMTAAEKDWLDKWDNMKSRALKDIDQVEDRLRAIKDKEVTVYINEKVKKATGGLVQRFARGGRLPGYGGGDRISALLEAGEFIIRKEAVAKFGAGLFARLNSLQLPDFARHAARFATGGAVAAPAGVGVATLPPIAITLNYSGGGTRADARAMTEMVMAELQRQYRRASR